MCELRELLGKIGHRHLGGLPLRVGHVSIPDNLSRMHTDRATGLVHATAVEDRTRCSNAVATRSPRRPEAGWQSGVLLLTLPRATLHSLDSIYHLPGGFEWR